MQITITKGREAFIVGGLILILIVVGASWLNSQPLPQPISVSVRQIPGVRPYPGPSLLKTNGDLSRWQAEWSCYGTGANPDGSGGPNPVPVCTPPPTRTATANAATVAAVEISAAKCEI